MKNETPSALINGAIRGASRSGRRPLRDAPRIAPLISALGVSFFISYSMQLMFGAEQRDYNVFEHRQREALLSGLDIRERPRSRCCGS